MLNIGIFSKFVSNLSSIILLSGQFPTKKLPEKFLHFLDSFAYYNASVYNLPSGKYSDMPISSRPFLILYV